MLVWLRVSFTDAISQLYCKLAKPSLGSDQLLHHSGASGAPRRVSFSSYASQGNTMECLHDSLFRGFIPDVSQSPLQLYIQRAPC